MLRGGGRTPGGRRHLGDVALPEPWDPAAGPSSRKPSGIPGSTPSVPGLPPIEMQAGLQKSSRKRSQGDLLPVCAQEPRSPGFVHLLEYRLPPQDQEDKEVDGKLQVAEGRDAKAAVQEATQGGPDGAGQRLYRGAEAQHGPCGGEGRESGPGGFLGAPAPAAQVPGPARPPLCP